MIQLTVIRHAPTSSNDGGQFMGNLDVPSTAVGLAAARYLGDQLRSSAFSRHFTSPLRRAYETCHCLFPHAQIERVAALRERGLGEWEGKSKAEIRVACPAAFLESGRVDPNFVPPGGESMDVFVARVRSFLVTIADGGHGTNVVAVTHNGVICAIRHLLLGLSLRKMFENAEPFLSPACFDLRLAAGAIEGSEVTGRKAGEP